MKKRFRIIKFKNNKPVLQVKGVSKSFEGRPILKKLSLNASMSLIKNDLKFIGHNFAGKYLDCGTLNGYIKSSLEISK